MASGDIKQKIVLEGEKEYKNAIREAQRNLKTLRSELKAETAELGANATAQQKNEAKVKSLQKQIREQEKIVKANRDALKEVREHYGDNAEAVAKWEQKLNESRATLANMKNDLDNVGKGFKEVQGNADMATVATKSVADAIGRLGDVGDAISSSIEGIFTGLYDTVKATVGKIWDMVTETAEKANNWTDLASYYGTTADAIERVNSAVTMSQGNFSDFTNLLNQLSWGGKGDKITEWLGVSEENYQDKLSYTMAVLESMQNLMKTDPSKLEKAMEEIFGAKKSQQIMWFVSNLDQIKANLDSYDEHGYSLGTDALETMNQVWLKVGEIEEKWEKLRQKFAAGFGKVTLDILTNVSGGLDAIADYLNAESDAEREEAIGRLEQNLTEAFERAKTAIEHGVELIGQVADDLQNSENPTARALGNVLDGVVKALEWFTEDNMNNVVQALEILAGFWLAGKGLSLVSTIAEFAGNIATIKAFKALSLGTEIGTSVGGSFLSVLAARLPAVLTAALLAVPIIDMLKNPEKYDPLKNPEKKQAVEDTKEAMEPLTGGTVKNAFVNGRDALHAMLGAGKTPAEKKEESETAASISKAEAALEEIAQAVTSQEAGPGALAATPEQRAAAESFWDIYRANPYEMDTWEQAEEDMIRALSGNEAVLDKLNDLMDYLVQSDETDSWRSLEDLPASWWRDQGGNNGDQLTGADARSMTGAVNSMPKAVAQAVSGLRVYMDGATVGRIVAPYVSTQIAAGIG